jgi:hypothetical protein
MPVLASDDITRQLDVAVPAHRGVHRGEVFGATAGRFRAGEASVLGLGVGGATLGGVWGLSHVAACAGLTITSHASPSTRWPFTLVMR